MSAKPTGDFLFLPLGGAGEIGMNLNCYAYDNKWIIADLGVTFADESIPGVDLILPDPAYLVERREDLLAIILTHAHEDHFGAVAHLWRQLRCPVYATPFTAHLLAEKLAEVGLVNEVPVRVVPLGHRFDVGPFDLELITITHSIAEPNALAIRTPAGTVLHTGDFKIDPEPLIGEVTDNATLRAVGDEGVLAMVCDSTNVLNAHASGSEASVRDSLVDLVEKQTGKVAITSFASNIARMDTAAHVAQETGRHLVLVGRAMHRNLGAAQAAGYLSQVKPVDEKEAGFLPHEKVLYLCTGSQGETRGAMARIASGNHPHVLLDAGDTVIFSSKIIPGNELSLAHLHNQLALRGVNVITERDAHVHVSGHPGRAELAEMYGWVKPKTAIPVHGEARHLKAHGEFCQELQIPNVVVPENGSLIRLAPGKPQIIDQVYAGRLVLDGDILVDHDAPSIVHRRRMAYNGQITVSAVLDGKGRLVDSPTLSLLGIPDESNVALEVLEIIEEKLSQLGKSQVRDMDKLSESLRVVARRTVHQMTGKKPVTVIQLHRLPDRLSGGKQGPK